MKVKLHKAINFHMYIKEVFRLYKRNGNKPYKLQTLPLGTSGTTLWSNLTHILNLQLPGCSTFVAYVKKFCALNKNSVSCSLQRHFMNHINSKFVLLLINFLNILDELCAL
jgi:hypothetical protein